MTADEAAGAAVRRERGEAPVVETDLYPPIKAFLEAQGYRVKGEVRGCDVVGVRGAEDPVIVELKTRFGLPLILQAVARQRLTDSVYIAFPRGGGALWRRKQKDARALCRRLGLGLLLVRLPGAGASATVVPELDPAPYRPRPCLKRKGLLLREFERRRGDPSPGGAARTPIMTAYRQDALACAAHLAAAGPASPAAIKKAAGIEAAGRILARDVYGWFVRVERGVYDLSEKGRHAAHAGAAEPRERAEAVSET